MEIKKENEQALLLKERRIKHWERNHSLPNENKCRADYKIREPNWIMEEEGDLADIYELEEN